MIKRIFQEARLAGYEQLYLETSTELATAVAIYQHYGFTALKQALSNAAGHPAMNIWMIKSSHQMNRWQYTNVANAIIVKVLFQHYHTRRNPTAYKSSRIFISNFQKICLLTAFLLTSPVAHPLEKDSGRQNLGKP